MAFVHDYLTQFGGAERVLREMLKLFPDAPLYTALADRRLVRERFADVEVRTTFLQSIPRGVRAFRSLLPLYPLAFTQMDLRGYELVISSSTAFAHGVRTPPDSVHVAYINTPARFLWFPDEYAWEVTPGYARPFAALAMGPLRRWDLAAARRPTHLIANSQHVAARIRAVYGRESDVVHCPVDATEFNGGSRPTDDYFLVLTRLLPYKRVQLALQACEMIGARLIVAGSGPDERRLRALAGTNTTFAGQVSDEERRQLLARARAVIVPGVEDFGLVALEAAAAGRPTVAFAAGGSLETVVEGATGILFREPTAAALADALTRLSGFSFEPGPMLEHAQRFSPAAFRDKLRRLIDGYLSARAPAAGSQP